MEKIIVNISTLPNIIKQHIQPLISDQAILAFIGQIGAGKTTIIKEILKNAGVASMVNSPTFGYVHTYIPDTGLLFNHFDLYRIDSIETFLNQALDEYLHMKNSVNLIEWPEIILPLIRSNKELNQRIITINISYLSNQLDKRMIHITK